MSDGQAAQVDDGRDRCTHEEIPGTGRGEQQRLGQLIGTGAETFEIFF